MNVLKIVGGKMNLALVCIGAALCASAVPTVTIDSVTQRWPWNNLVDIDFTISGTAEGEAYYVDVSGTYDNGNRSLFAKTFATEPIAATGKNRVVWNLGADYPEFKADDLVISVTVTPFSDSTPVYLVVDLSGGGSAVSWPVRYTTTAPVHTAGVEDPCKTTELWLKRVKAGTITMGGGSYDSYPSYTCTLTNDYYLGIFSLTQAQSQNIGYKVALTGYQGAKWGAYFTNESCRATRPCDTLRYTFLRQPYYDSSNPDAALTGDGIIKRLRDKTELNFDLPTEWQWEYACRAGRAKAIYPSGTTERYSNNSNPPADYQYKDNKTMWEATYGTSYVDTYDSNAWGFYGMIGNVYEITLNNNLQTITSLDSMQRICVLCF